MNNRLLAYDTDYLRFEVERLNRALDVHGKIIDARDIEIASLKRRLESYEQPVVYGDDSQDGRGVIAVVCLSVAVLLVAGLVLLGLNLTGR